MGFYLGKQRRELKVTRSYQSTENLILPEETGASAECGHSHQILEYEL